MKLPKLLALFLCAALFAVLPKTAIALTNGVQADVVQNSYAGLTITTDSAIMLGVEPLEQGGVDWEVTIVEDCPGANLVVVSLLASANETVAMQMKGTVVEQVVTSGHIDDVPEGYFILLFTVVPDETSEQSVTGSSIVFDVTVTGKIEENTEYPPSLRIASRGFETFGYPRAITLEAWTEPGNRVYAQREQVSTDADGRAVFSVDLSRRLVDRIEVRSESETGHVSIVYATVINHWVTENPAEQIYLSQKPLLSVDVPDTSIIDGEASTVEIDGQPADIHVSSPISIAFSCVTGTPSTPLDYGDHTVVMRFYSTADVPGRTDKLLDVVSWGFEIPSIRQAQFWPGKAVCIVNDEEFELDAAPFRDPATGSTMLPLRFVGDLMGAQVTWRGSDQTATFTLGEKTVQLSIGKKTALVNGKQVTLAAPPANIGGRTMVPLRFVSESLGAEVSWDPATSTIQVEVLLEEPDLTVG